MPFGNAAYSTPDDVCGMFNTTGYAWSEFPGYDPDMRQCWEKKCGLDAKAAASSCYSGKAYCQHGGAECAVNAIGACAKHVTKADWTQYGMVVSCLEDYYDKIGEAEDDGVINSSIEKCTKGWLPNLRQALLGCYHSQAEEQLKAVAKKTPVHPGVPFVRVKNKSGAWMEFELGSDSLLLETICANWKYNGGSSAKACAEENSGVAMLTI